MLRIYYGKENVDKEGFLFNLIAARLSDLGKKDEPKKVVLLVPDQYTLEAERSALSLLGVRGLMDLEILSQNRLVERVLSETGGNMRTPIDRNGRHMLLWKVLDEENENLRVFKGMGSAPAFIDKMNNLISEIKQHNTDADRLSDILSKGDENSLLYRKLFDINRIYRRYQEYLKDCYIDNEDHLDFFISKLSCSFLAKESEFFIYGFDYFTPKSISIIGELAHKTKGVSVILTCDRSDDERGLFKLTDRMMDKLSEAAHGAGVSVIPIIKSNHQINPVIAHVEQQIFACPPKPFSSMNDVKGPVLCSAANFHAEVETAAAYVSFLVREKGLRYRDIAVICNDLEGRGQHIKRVFEEYGIHFFMDHRRSVMHNPIILFVSSLLSAISEDWNTEDVFLVLKTGLSPLPMEACEDLENYAISYKIRGSRWKKEFRYGVNDLGEEALRLVEESRRTAVDFIFGLERMLSKATTVNEKVSALRSFLEDKADLPAKVSSYSEHLNEQGEYEASLEMSQIWEGLLGLFEQMTELAGGLEISVQDFLAMLKSGFSSLELGLIPSTIDQVVVGTMQRTRVGKVKALIVIGVNDGVLPKDSVDDDLLNRDERALLLHLDICKDDDFRIMEERLSIYRNLSKPERYLYLSYSASDEEGRELRPSLVFNQLKQMFPEAPLEKDIHNRDEPMELIGSQESTLVHLVEALRKARSGDEPLSPYFKAAFNWYRENRDQRMEGIRKGLFHINETDRLKPEIVEALYKKDAKRRLTLSPSRLERFGRCPFSHLVLYGLVPKERRIFEVASREAGEIYHECLMRLADNLSVPGMEITDEMSPFMSLTKEQCDEKVDAIMDRISKDYKEGMLLSGQEEKYREKRIRDVCKRAAFAMIEQVRQGKIRKMFFEEYFGDGRAFPAIEINAGGRIFYIEGIIDRIDVLDGNFVKVIDYKSGSGRFDLEEAKSGYRLQLMLYLRAALGGLKPEGEINPAGVFYFEIREPSINVTGLAPDEQEKKLVSELEKVFRMDGVLLDDPKIIKAVDGSFTGYSRILPLYKSKDGNIKGTSDGKLLSQKEFQSFYDEVDRTITSLCDSLASGTIDIRPKKSGNETACDYCQLNSICNFDLSFDGCSYDVIK